MKYHIDSKAWQVTLKILRATKGIHAQKEEVLRRFIEGVYLILRNGSQWQFLPEEYGQYDSVYRRFRRWAVKGIWEEIFEAVKKDPDTEYIILDSTIVRAHSCAAGYKKNGSAEQALGRSRGGHSTKIHALTDALGNPLKFVLTPGQDHDITQAQNLIDGYSNSVVIADKDYDSDEFVQAIRDSNSTPVVPSRKNRIRARKYDKHLYGQRNVVEIFFGFFKHYRRIFARFEKTSCSYLGLIHFAASLIWLR